MLGVPLPWGETLEGKTHGSLVGSCWVNPSSIGKGCVQDLGSQGKEGQIRRFSDGCGAERHPISVGR